MRKHKVSSVYLSELYNALREINTGFTAWYRVKHKGMMFKLTRLLTDSEKEHLSNKFSNVIHYISQCQYAPELKYSAILVTDKTVAYLMKTNN